MTIETSIAPNIRRPGRFAEFNIASAARGLTPLTQRIALIGALDSAGSASAGELHQIFTEAKADDLFGQGSELALMCRWAIKATRDYGAAPEIWAVGIADAGGAAAEQTLTVSGPATEDGVVKIRIAGREIQVAVSNGDTDDDIAADIESAIDELAPELGVTAAVALNVVTCTAVNTGVNGNDIEYDVVQVPAGVGVASAQSVAGSGTVDITASLDLLEDKDYDIVACANHASTDVSDFADHIATTWAATAKRWRHTLMAERGTLATAQALATSADDWRQMVISAEGFRNTPAEIAAYVGTMLAAETDPALPWNDVELPSLYLPEKSDIPTNAELESGIGGGLFMLSVNEKQTQAKIVRAVTTKVTHSSVPYYELLDYTIGRSLYYGFRQIDIQDAIAFQRAKKNDRTRKAIRSVTLRTMFLLEDLEIWQNVSNHADELLVENDDSVSTRLNRTIPASVVPPLNQIASVVNLLVE